MIEAPFQLDSTIDTAKSAVVEHDGDLFIEGWASTVGADRAGDLVEPGAFDTAIEKFLSTNPILLYNHDIGKALGQVVEMQSRPQGLWVKARVDKPAPGSWAEDIVSKIAKGTIKAFSVRGKMWRPDGRLAAAPRDGGGRVNRVDLYEISATPLPVEPGSLFSVTQKAFDISIPAEEIPEEEARAIADYIRSRFDHLEQAYSDLTRGVDAITSAAAAREGAR